MSGGSTGVLNADELRRAAAVASIAAQGSDVEALLPFLADPSWPVRRKAVAAVAAIGEPAVEPLARQLTEARDDEARIAATVDALVAVGGDVTAALKRLAAHSDPAVVADVAQILGRRRARQGIPQLVALVEHGDDNVAVAAIEGLGRIGGPGGIEALIRTVESGSFFRVFPAIDVLGRSGDLRALAPLVALLGSPTYMLEAARALGRTGETAAIPGLVALLASPSQGTARVAAVAIRDLVARHLERFGDAERVEDALRSAHPGSAAMRRLAQHVADADVAEQKAIGMVLGTFGGDAAPAALRKLLDAPEPIASTAATSLRRLGSESEEEIRLALHEGGSGRRRVLLKVVAGANACSEVIECLTDPDPKVRVLACEALGRIGAISAVPSLFQQLEDGSPLVVQAAIAAIQSLGSSMTKALAVAATRHPNPAVQRAAMRILAYFGFAGTHATFVEAIEGDDVRLGEIALSGLALLDEPAAIDAILRTASADQPVAKLRAAAMRALAQVASDDERIAEALRLGTQDGDAWVRYYACQALGRRRTPGASQPIAALMADPAGQVRVASIEALAAIGDDDSIVALRAAVDGEDADVRRAALIGLGMARRPDALPILLAAAGMADAATRLVSISALAELDGAEALAALIAAVTDPDENVRVAAVGFVAARSGPAASAALIDRLPELEAVDRERILNHLAQPRDGRIAAILAALPVIAVDLVAGLIATLVRLRSPEAVAALRQVATSPSPSLRCAAASGLAAAGSGEALEALQSLAEEDSDPVVRQVCALLLAR